MNNAYIIGVHGTVLEVLAVISYEDVWSYAKDLLGKYAEDVYAVLIQDEQLFHEGVRIKGKVVMCKDGMRNVGKVMAMKKAGRIMLTERG